MIGMQLYFHDSKPKIFLLGDSAIGNYRLEPGQRMQDFMERMDPSTRVVNWAEPGATPLDFFLQFSRGTFLVGRPQSAIIALAPDKFLDLDDHFHRLDEDGVNLRWIPWNRAGVELFRRLSPRERSVAVVQQASLPFYALADVVRSLWIQHIQWPWERSRMRLASSDRRRRIYEKSLEKGRAQEALKIVGDEDFGALPLARDAEFLLRTLHDQGIETRVIVLPYGNPNLIQKTCSVRVLADHDTIVARMHVWLDGMDETYVDMNAASAREYFTDSAWDDLDHLKAPSAFDYMSKKVYESLTSQRRVYNAKPRPPGHLFSEN